MTILVRAKNWKRKGANLPKSIVIAKAKTKRARVVSRARAQAGQSSGRCPAK